MKCQAQIRDSRRIEQLRDIIALAQEEIDAIERRNYSSVPYQQHVAGNWFTVEQMQNSRFTKGRYPSECHMPQGHPSHCGCY